MHITYDLLHELMLCLLNNNEIYTVLNCRSTSKCMKVLVDTIFEKLDWNKMIDVQLERRNFSNLLWIIRSKHKLFSVPVCRVCITMRHCKLFHQIKQIYLEKYQHNLQKLCGKWSQAIIHRLLQVETWRITPTDRFHMVFLLLAAEQIIDARLLCDTLGSYPKLHLKYDRLLLTLWKQFGLPTRVENQKETFLEY